MLKEISEQLNLQTDDKTIDEFSKTIFNSIQKHWYQTNLYSFGLTTFLGGILTFGFNFVVSGIAAAGVRFFFHRSHTKKHQDTQNVVQTLETITQDFINSFDSKVHDEITYLYGIIFLSSLCQIYIKQNSFKLNLEQIQQEAPEIIKIIAQDLQNQLTKK
jgi:hypothetical protein